MKYPDGETVNYTYHPQLALNSVAGMSGYVTVSYYDAGGEWAGEQRYKAWGEVRYAAGVMPTKYTYTGQYSYTEGFGLMFYNARWYDPAVGRFAQGDTIVPDPYNTQSWDRFAYAYNNPVLFTDPTGHGPSDPWNLWKKIIQFSWILIDNTIEFAQGNYQTARDLVINIPGLIPKGFGFEQGIANVTYKINPVRTFGRTIGDSMSGPLLIIGFAITIAPEQIENIKNGASPGEFIGDYAVDTLGFYVSEAAGATVGFFTPSDLSGKILIKLSIDLGTGSFYDWIADKGFREYIIDHFGEPVYQMIIDYLEDQLEEYNNRERKPLPIPSPAPSTRGTPIPM